MTFVAIGVFSLGLGVVLFRAAIIAEREWTALEASLGVMGLVFAGLGGVIWRSARGPDPPPVSMLDIEMEDRFRPSE
jgi:hypothetical protein